jgi:hypothetical protein
VLILRISRTWHCPDYGSATPIIFQVLDPLLFETQNGQETSIYEIIAKNWFARLWCLDYPEVSPINMEARIEMEVTESVHFPRGIFGNAYR